MNLPQRARRNAEGSESSAFRAIIRSVYGLILRRSATKNRLPGTAKDLGDDKPHGAAYRHVPYTQLQLALKANN
jgi:hypothetical protein